MLDQAIFFMRLKRVGHGQKGPTFPVVMSFTVKYKKFDECTLSATFKPLKAVCVMDGRTFCILCMKENQFVIRPKA